VRAVMDLNRIDASAESAVYLTQTYAGCS